MKKKVKRILAASLMSLSLFGSLGAYGVCAASSVSGTLDGRTCSGSLRFVDNKTGATATTSYPAAASIYATVNVYYYNGGVLTVAHASSYNMAGGTSATAHTQDSITASSASGTHKVSVASGTWTASTSI